jgi:hypothetical protein
VNTNVLITGKGRYPRAIRELQVEAMRARPGFVPGARVSITSRGVLIEPDGTGSSTLNAPRTIAANTPRWG